MKRLRDEIFAIVAIATATVIGVAWAGCGDDEEPGEITSVGNEPTVVAAEVEPEFGGNVVVAGQYPIEVVAHQSGEVFAYVHGTDEPPLDAELTVDVPVVGRRTPRPLRLRWNEYEERYEGILARLEVEPGPLAIHYEVGGRVYDGTAQTIVVAPAMQVDVVEVRRPAAAVEVEVVEPRVRVGRRKHKHKHRRRKHMRRKHRRRGGGSIEIRF